MKGADECDERSLSLLFQKNYCYYLAQQSVNRLSKRGKKKKKEGKKEAFFSLSQLMTPFWQDLQLRLPLHERFY